MGSPTNSPVRLGVSPAAATATGFFSAGSFLSLCWDLGLRGLFHVPAVPPGLSMCECGATGSASHHLVGSASCSLACPVPQSTTSLGLPATALLQVLSPRLPISAPPTGLDECFFFISLVVRLPYSSIFCQFWLVFIVKLLLSFFWLCKGAECVYLRLHLGWKPASAS